MRQLVLSQLNHCSTDKFFQFVFVFDLDGGLSALVDKFERPVFLVTLNVSVIEFATDKSLGVENGV